MISLTAVYTFLACSFAYFVYWYLKDYLKERRLWNHGKCSDCHRGWDYYTYDSQGGRGYKCNHGSYDVCNSLIWITYPIDRNGDIHFKWNKL